MAKEINTDLPKILIVDDRPINIQLLERILKEMEAIFISALSGKEALSLAMLHDFAIILLDVQMPVMDGFETAEKLMANEKTKHIPIIFITANNKNETDVRKGLELGAADYVFKPVEPALLKSKIRYILEVYKRAKVEEEFSKLHQSHDELKSVNTKLESMTIQLKQQSLALESANKELEEKSNHLEKQIEAFYNIVGRSNTGILIIDRTGVIKFVNPATEKLFKKESKNLIGHEIGFPIEGESNLELDIWRSDKSLGTGEMNTTSTKWAGEEAYLLFINDITHLKKIENDLIQLSSELKERNQDLDAYNHTVAHDLRGHLEVMSGFANLLYYDAEQISQEKLKEYSKYIFATSNTLTNVIKELLLFASLPKAEIKTTEIVMKEIVASVIENTSITIKESNAEISLPDSWFNSIGYAPWVEEVWKNYISNTLKYGGDPPKIKIGCDQILSKKNKKFIKYWIKDQGPGISEENQKLLFKKFERLDKAKASGHGLGLSIVRRIVNKLGGTAGIESIIGQGSTFYFTLPANDNIPDDQTIIQNNTGEVGTSAIQKENNIDQKEQVFLVVEDTYVSFQLLELLLKQNGNNIIRAKNGEEAVELCRENQNIRLVLMDINLPLMDGYEATRQIKKIRPKLPIIAQTAYAVFGDREKSLEAGCDDYITKPINNKELVQKIRNYLD